MKYVKIDSLKYTCCKSEVSVCNFESEICFQTPLCDFMFILLLNTVTSVNTKTTYIVAKDSPRFPSCHVPSSFLCFPCMSQMQTL